MLLEDLRYFLSLLLALGRFLRGVLAQPYHRHWLRMVRPTHARDLDFRVIDQLVLDGRRRHVLALGRLEDLLRPSRDLEPSHGIDLSSVARPEPPVLGNHLLGRLLVLVVPDHEAGRLELNLTVVGDALLDARVGLADVARAGPALLADVGIVHVLGHAVSLEELQAETAVPLDELLGDGGRSGAGEADSIEAQSLQNLLPDEHADDRDGHEGVELLGRHLLEDALLELRPEARDRHEKGRVGPVQVLDKGLERIGEEELGAAKHHPEHSQPPFHAVRQGQVREVGITRRRLDHAAHALSRLEARLEVVHDALGTARRAGRVDDGGDLLRLPIGDLVDGFVRLDDVVPLLAFIRREARTALGLGGQREGHDGRVVGDALLHLLPGLLVELAHEHELRLGVLQDVRHGVLRERGIHRHGDQSRHHRGDVGHDPPRAVLGADGDLGSRLQLERFEVRRHLLALDERLAERPVLEVVGSASHGLRHEALGGVLLAQAEEGLEEGVGLGDVGDFLLVALGRRLRGVAAAEIFHDHG
mmetsp:Transcript_19459/g.36430  ORF Transcript_19459/g.36430 Transcript_19459/m.36430 type:complete len:532 (-) Transcript_19459:261-1856(-)